MATTDAQLIRMRDYQTEAKDAVWNAWRHLQRPAVLLPTGSGKTVIFSHMIDHYCMAWPSARVVILVHRDELADQAIEKLKRVAPDLSVGKVKAADNQIGARVMVCSVQTLARSNRLEELVGLQTVYGRIGLVIVDECHHAAAKSYQKIMRALGCFDDHYHEDESTRAVGFTATMARGDGVGLGSTWQEIVYSRSTPWMIARGYLVDVRGQNVDLDALDLSGIKVSGGDYQAGALGQAIMAADGPSVIARAMTEYADGRKSMVFLPDVASAYATAAALDREGIICDVIEGNTSRDERRLIFKKSMNGDLRAIVNCMVLTEGTDLPWMDCAVIARPTRSEPLFVQMAGRVMRTWVNLDGTEKGDALILMLNGAGGRIATLADLAPGVVKTVKPSETLAEAVIRQAEEDNKVEFSSDNLAFCLKHKDVDLFRASTRQWLRTPGGVMFIPYGKGFVFLWPRKDSPNWDVCAAVPHRPWRKYHHDLPLGTAQAWAETIIEERGGIATYGTISQRSASWRRELARPGQIGKARSLGIKVTGTPTKGWLSDQISIRLASNVFDSYVNKA